MTSALRFIAYTCTLAVLAAWGVSRRAHGEQKLDYLQQVRVQCVAATLLKTPYPQWPDMARYMAKSPDVCGIALALNDGVMPVHQPLRGERMIMARKAVVGDL